MKIRRIKESDRKQLQQLIDEFKIKFARGDLIKDSALFPLSEYLDEGKSLNTAVDELYDKTSITFVAEDNGHVAGYISGKIKHQEGKKFYAEGYIDEWFVSENNRSKGIGKKLYKKLIQKFRQKGCTHLGITAYIENTKASEFYRELGFKDYLLTLKKLLD